MKHPCPYHVTLFVLMVFHVYIMLLSKQPDTMSHNLSGMAELDDSLLNIDSVCAHELLAICQEQPLELLCSHAQRCIQCTDLTFEVKGSTS